MEIAKSIISLLGGLAMFLYGMRLMGNSLKEGSSGTFKQVMGKVTNNPFKAFLLGVFITAIIQSSTATIVITSGLVVAGVISLDQSLGIIVGANVGTTVTGQIIRLLDISDDSGNILQFFKPDFLAPLALTIGIVFLMFCSFRKSDLAGNIAVGFGILFTGLVAMTASVTNFNMSGVFARMGSHPALGYGAGAAVAFVLQSSSSSIGILQAFSASTPIAFKTVAFVLCGVYLGDCVTTGIVCFIGTKPDSKRVGIINILYNLGKTVLVLAVLGILHAFGYLDSLWNMPLKSGGIANSNTIFNIVSAFVLLPFIGICKRISYRLIKDEPKPEDRYADKIAALNPVFFSTPALALNSCYDALKTMFTIASANINKALNLFQEYNTETYAAIDEDEDGIDRLADAVSNYLVQLSPHVNEEMHIRILDQYYKVVTEFERLGDHAMNIAESARGMNEQGMRFSDDALRELLVIRELLDWILEHTKNAFEKRDVEAARHIEPLEEVMDDMINALDDNHVARLREGRCTVYAGTRLMDIMSNLERISDTCSNVGVSVVARVNPDMDTKAHSYISSLHQGQNEEFNEEYHRAHDLYFKRLALITKKDREENSYEDIDGQLSFK